MPARRLRVEVSREVEAGVAAIRAEHELPVAFPPEVEAEAAAATGERAGRADLRDVVFFTIDPAGARDLDQAMALERDGRGYRVRYAIADLPAFVEPAGALDREALARGLTVYLPRVKVPLHPPALSEGSASLLPGVDRPALVWDMRLDHDGELVEAELIPALVRSHAQLTYENANILLLREIGRHRLDIAAARGASRLALPEQEVVYGPWGWTVAYRAQLPVEEHNAEISLMTGMAAARIMVERGAGILRSQSAPDPAALDALRAKAAAVGVPMGDDYPQWVSALDAATPAHAALLHEAATAGEPARYVAFDGSPPADADHFAIAAPYAHVTAPLRRLVDRYALALCLPDPPQWARDGLAAIPDAMAAAARRAGSVERAVVDLVEAVLLQDRVGDEFDAVALDDQKVLLSEPAVRARAEGTYAAGDSLRVRLTEADPAKRRVHFEAL